MSAKRQQLILNAFALFYEKGVHAVGINEVLAVSGIAKKTLYTHFASKEELVCAVLEYRNAAYLRWLEQRLDAANEGVAKVDALFDALDDWFHDREEVLFPFHGCFFMNVSGEYGDPECAIHQQCAKHKVDVEAIVLRAVKTLDLSEQACAELAAMLCLLKDGAISKARVQGDKTAAASAKKVARQLV
ncbi:putative HTH-type transcriptional regulator YxaF [Pseudovibrio axinellae]|uniref:Putative HTH-type transcriptional regulator YxaF n=1 Tax=Pseudovibrio axinellae TaxID=989403 RepID=A0A166ARU0_9HYPH|nr:TetR/AcrR family transcriptional regulator [Pseudovibrio axinellae]KZL21476.1 putative HTH-type transcriptional regulator YxaF [Pseudovibrio axinellae]SER06568.1 transcriptional regulator, TetR family [Pseudovibrio axinellae]